MANVINIGNIGSKCVKNMYFKAYDVVDVML